MCKSTQDLAMFIAELTAIRNKQVIVSVYPDKSFLLYEVEGHDMVTLYQSDNVSDGMDINDLPYEDAKEFSKHIDELASIDEVLSETKIFVRSDKFADV